MDADAANDGCILRGAGWTYLARRVPDDENGPGFRWTISRGKTFAVPWPMTPRGPPNGANDNALESVQTTGWLATGGTGPAWVVVRERGPHGRYLVHEQAITTYLGLDRETVRTYLHHTVGLDEGEVVIQDGVAYQEWFHR
jgi:hypothetical protein